MMINHLLRSTVRRGTWRQQTGASMRWATSSGTKKSDSSDKKCKQTLQKELRYENLYFAQPGKVETTKVVTNQNISYAQLCDLQRKFGEHMKIGMKLEEEISPKFDIDKLQQENIDIMNPIAESILNYFDFQEPRAPEEAVKATMAADKLLREEFKGTPLLARAEIEICEEAINYLMDYYGDGGLSSHFFNPPVSKAEVVESYRLYCLFCHVTGETNDMDTIGRENMRNLMLLARRCAPIELLGPGTPASIQRVCSIIFPE